jgi:hypothetical protein
MGGTGCERSTRSVGRATRPLPLEARQALWQRLWDRLLLPEDLRDPDETPATARKDAPPERDGVAREGR